MHPAIRTQADGLQYEYSKKTALQNDGTPSLTRQEQKDDADINILLKRFGVANQVRANGRYGEFDEQTDLHSALAAIQAARDANYNVPAELRDKYPNWQTVLAGAENGSYERDLLEIHNKRKAERLTEERAAKRREIELNRAVEADLRAEAAAELARRQTDTPVK